MPPWSFEANLSELEILPSWGVDEVIVKVDTEEYSHGIVPLDWLENYRKNLLAIREKLAELGMIYSLNPWFTQGHCDRGRRAEMTLPGVQTMIDWDGSVSTACCCPLSPVWREHMRKTWRLYAETEPKVLWLEDDIRSFSHGAVKFGCFCPLHMKRFSERVGKNVDREELVKALLKPGEPHPWRKEYLRMQGEIMVEVARMIGETVHAVSPETSLGLMSSGPRNHTMEGRNWKAFSEALADGKPLYSRPPGAVYQEFALRDLYIGCDAILHTRKLLPPGTIEQGEVDNWSYTRYAKSVTLTALQMSLSAALGCSGVTLNLFDHAGTPMAADPAFGRMLREKKNYLNSLTEVCGVSGRYRGAQLLFSERYGEAVQLSTDATLFSLAEDGTQTVNRLYSHGIPVVYEEENFRVACGQSIRNYSDSQLCAMLGKGQGMFLDALAAGIMVKRGLGDLIGVKSAEPPVKLTEKAVVSAEEYRNPDFGGAEGKLMNLFVDGAEPLRFSEMSFAPDSVEITRIVDPELKRFASGIVVYENRLGGRVAVSTQTMQEWGLIYNNDNRRILWERLSDYLSFGHFPVRLQGDGVYPMLFRKDCEKWIATGFFNFSLDPWNDPSLSLCVEEDETFEAAELICPDGSLAALPFSREKNTVYLRPEIVIPACHGLVIRLFRKKP